jgi:prepilin-type N-terminal cleavage/methylation domain-containing protein
MMRRISFFRSGRQSRPPGGFTLIELLIVVAIIAILAAIAVPNFLEAQTRSKVSRVRSDHRTLATALESYKIDNTKYPVDWSTMTLQNWPAAARKHDSFCVRFALFPLTTPVAQLTSLPGSPFEVEGSLHGTQTFKYGFGQDYGSEYVTQDYIHNWAANFFTRNSQGQWVNGLQPQTHLWRLRDSGPDRYVDNEPIDQAVQYDPTNGTVSRGDIVRYGP